MLPDLEASARLRASDLKAPYNDPIFRSKPRAYADFCRKLFEAGLVEFRTPCKERVGAFCVEAETSDRLATGKSALRST